MASCGMLQVVVASAVSAIRNNINRSDWNLGDLYNAICCCVDWRKLEASSSIVCGICYRELIALVVSVALSMAHML